MIEKAVMVVAVVEKIQMKRREKEEEGKGRGEGGEEEGVDVADLSDIWPMMIRPNADPPLMSPTITAAVAMSTPCCVAYAR